MEDIRQLIDAPKSDLFDVLSCVLFTTPPKTREDRAGSVRKGGLEDADEEMKGFLLGVLRAYEHRGESELAARKLGDFLTAKYGTLADAKSVLGEIADIRSSYLEMQKGLYAS